MFLESMPWNPYSFLLINFNTFQEFTYRKYHHSNIHDWHNTVHAETSVVTKWVLDSEEKKNKTFVLF